MRKLAFIFSLLAGFAVLSAPAVAQHKTIKACQEEWRANKAENQAKGITEKAYVAQCRAGTAQTQSAPAAPKTTTSKRTASPTQGTAPAAPAPSSRVRRTATAPSGANQYSTEAQAKARCGSGTVVWANLNSKIYHFAGHKAYGNTKSGAYMCERDATSEGMRAAKNEKHP
ncbi:MAG TPA: hypothetical protein VFS63_08675 [Pseudolabrys sp.]|jgi:hypothetical protein|nr:hypothetical protein [Pseudolabrys sp.]